MYNEEGLSYGLWNRKEDTDFSKAVFSDEVHFHFDILQNRFEIRKIDNRVEKQIHNMSLMRIL